ncbi:MAG: hypothetical protein ACR2NX_09490 [Chthoniobacterales bacterium]
MAKSEDELNRLFQSARGPEAEPEMPFGFATRVVALARETQKADGSESRHLARVLRRVALTALLVTALSGGAAYWQINQNDDLNEPLANAYAIADNAIETNAFP